MINLGAVIINLLSENDCVVVPDFGGFVAQYSPAKLDDSTGFFSPPSKQVLFNKNLINNDGLLVNAIAQVQAITFNDANKLIKNIVRDLNLELRSKKKTEINGLGLIYLYDNIVKFKQNSENILTDSYGLAAVNIKEFQQVIDVQKTKVVNLNNAKSSDAKKWWIAAAIIPMIFYSAWLPLKTNLFNDSASFHYSDLNPFTFTKQKQYFPENLFEIKQQTIDNFENQKIQSSVKKINPSVQLNNLENQNKPVSTIVDKPVYKQKKSGKFHLIVGCFSSKKNANNLIKTLSVKGENAVELDIHKNLHRISIASFATKKEAVKYKKQLKKNHRISSWILNK